MNELNYKVNELEENLEVELEEVSLFGNEAALNSNQNANCIC
ncbi:hypothetical protein NST54_01875 [Caldifermentibacillus hisashii]